ncbi:hypothetical protein TWF970_002027 [Orbilia oligospora]|uniref:Aminoglycoside phosphotransferase domain-containing protein n=1 Tax=Orbilia oligospora TaxID=2813651 RepID=A0A7C8VHS6_ORBOL|nr:hypothetical protein TWF970_002027 [Orbilia oligospora]
MNPYEADPANVPADDPYADVPLYGRYLPRQNDFRPKTDHIRSSTPESLRYWESVLKHLDSSTLLYEDPDDDARDVFAFGSTIVKSSHLKSTLPMRQYSLSDENELAATKVVRGALNRMEIEVPEIIFAGKVNGRDTLIQTRISGVTLNVALPYLNATQKASFKSQARKVLGQFRNIYSNSSSSLPSYLVPDNDPVKHRNITEEEKSILFGKYRDHAFDGKAIREEERSEDFCLMHNDLGTSNIIVNYDRIVGIIDWEMAGFFGLKRACAVHQQCRTPKREDFANLNLEEEHLADLTYWYDLYQLD